MSSYMQTPSPQNVPLRPLNKGMIRNISPQMLPLGAFYSAEGVYITENGPQRRDGFNPVGTQLPFADGLILDGLNFNNDGEKETLIMTETDLVRFTTKNGFTTITGGDSCFNGNRIYSIDHTVVPTSSGYSALFTDGDSYIRQYDGTEVTTFIEDFTNPLTLEYFNNYLWVGAPDSSHLNRLVWSNLDDSETFDESNYLDFLEEQEEILRVKGLGNLLVVYFPKAIYFGRPTNRVDLPYAFTRIETGQIGLVGRKALVSWDDGHFFVGGDDIYYFSATAALQPIGAAVIKEMLRGCSFREGIYAAVDPVNDSIVFGIPGYDQTIDQLWFFNYKSKAWSKTQLSCSAILSFGVYNEHEWGDTVMTLDDEVIDMWDGAGAGETDFESEGWTSWKSLESGLSTLDLFVAVDNQLFQSDGLINRDFINSPIDVLLESGDLDLDLPDTDKTFNRLSMKVDRVVGGVINFALYTSPNRGRTWEYKGDLVVPADEDEGKVNFRATGSTFRFRLVSNSNVDAYIINEIILRGRPRGLEVQG